MFAATSPSGEPLALKRPRSASSALLEYLMLSRVQAYPQYYVHLRASFYDTDGACWLEMDRLPGCGLGPLADNSALRSAFSALLTVPIHVSQSSMFPRPVILTCVQTLNHLHTVVHVIHCDIKPANLYYDGKARAVILMDFGSARTGPVFSGGAIHPCARRLPFSQVVAGTEGYVAPETEQDVAYYSSDVYSAACTIIRSVRCALDINSNSD